MVVLQRCKYYKEQHITLFVASEEVVETVWKDTYLIMLLGFLGLLSCPEPEAGNKTDVANMLMFA